MQYPHPPRPKITFSPDFGQKIYHRTCKHGHGQRFGIKHPTTQSSLRHIHCFIKFQQWKKTRILSNFSKLQSYTLTLDIAVMNLMKCNVTMAIRIIRFTLHFYETLELVHVWIRLLQQAYTYILLIPPLFRALYKRLSSLQKYNTWH